MKVVSRLVGEVIDGITTADQVDRAGRGSVVFRVTRGARDWSDHVKCLLQYLVFKPLLIIINSTYGL